MNSLIIENYGIINEIERNIFEIHLKVVEKKTGKLAELDILNVNKIVQENYTIKDYIYKFSDDCTKYMRFNHPAILKLKYFQVTNQNILIYKNSFLNEQPESTKCLTITKYLKNGNLSNATKEYLESNGQNCQKMNPTIRSKIIFGIASAMKYVHKQSFIHGNLKLESIYLDDNFEPKITNLGLSRNFIEFCGIRNKSINDIIYIAHEIMNDYEDYLASSDVYSFAFVIYKMFKNEIVLSDLRKIRSNCQFWYKIQKGLKPIKPDSMPDCYWDLVNKCWSPSTYDRPTFEDIIEILKDDKFAIDEFGMKTDIDQLHEYQKRVNI